MLQGVLLVPSHIPPPRCLRCAAGRGLQRRGGCRIPDAGEGGGSRVCPCCAVGWGTTVPGGLGGGESTPRVSAPMGGRRFSTLESAASAPRRAAVQHPGERRVRHPWERCPAGWGLPPGAAGSVSFPPPPPNPVPRVPVPPWVGAGRCGIPPSSFAPGRSQAWQGGVSGSSLGDRGCGRS